MGILALDSRASPSSDPPAVGSRSHPTSLGLSSPPPPYKSRPLSNPSSPPPTSCSSLPFPPPKSLPPVDQSVLSRSPTVGMNSFDSTFEALALHYVGFGLFTVVNNVWTIVALVTAALSFWRLRAASLPLPLPSDRRLESPPEALDSRPSCSPTPESTDEATMAPIHPSPNVPAAPPACDADVATKGRFVTYYREDDQGDEVDDDGEAELSGDRKWLGDRAGEWWEGWEKALRLRSNGAERGRGWYDYQDRAVLSGSVVRLWEEERWELMAASSVTSAGRSCVVFW